jgi:16S rRNA (adenine1518-N6/adenine1519-N6)-dimethyltransferase
MRRRTRAMLQAHGVRPRRGLGQSFLVAPGIARRIVEAAGVTAGDLVVEIGPGAGALTEVLLGRAGHLLAIEVDPRLHGLLLDRFGSPAHATWILGDALTYDYQAEVPRLAAGRRALVVANLPYAVATPILLRLLDCGRLFASLVVMLQREVADRLAAAPGTKAYGPLTLAVQLRAAARRLFTVPPAAFHPRPAVASAVVVLAPHGLPPVPPAQWPAVEIVVRAAFGRRRKMLRQALAGPGTGLAPAGAAAALGAAGIDGRRRGETLSLEEFHRLASVMATSRAGAGP